MTKVSSAGDVPDSPAGSLKPVVFLEEFFENRVKKAFGYIDVKGVGFGVRGSLDRFACDRFACDCFRLWLGYAPVIGRVSPPDHTA